MNHGATGELPDRLGRARRVAVLTGAGVSAESGVPTFRGTDGLWRQHRAEDLATPEAFRRDPKLVWEWYDWRRQLIARCQPNPAHRAIAFLERRAPEFLLITQNVDGLHRLAGSVQMVEVHGNLWRVRCLLVVGTSAVVQPAASLPMIARRRGAYVVEVNLEPTPLTSLAHESHHGKAGDILPRLLGLDSSILNPQSAIQNPGRPCSL